MNKDVLIVTGTILWVLLWFVYWILQSIFRAEMKRGPASLTYESVLRLGHIAASHVLLRCLWAGATFVAAISYGMWFADPVNKLMATIVPASIMPTYASITLVIYVRLGMIWSERISFMYNDLFKPRNDPEA